MKISDLEGSWIKRNFSLKKINLVPSKSGVYALTNFFGDILYIGISKNLKRRFLEHIHSKKFYENTPQGVSFWFYYCLKEKEKHRFTERGFLSHIELSDGKLPWFNKIRAPS